LGHYQGRTVGGLFGLFLFQYGPEQAKKKPDFRRSPADSIQSHGEH